MSVKGKMDTELHKSFVWYGLRISFWIMVSTALIGGFFTNLNPSASGEEYWIGFMAINSFLMMIFVIFTFVISIIHLVKYKKKAFAVVSLVFSSIFLLLFLFGVLSGIIESSTGTTDTVDILNPNQVSFRPFADQYTMGEIDLEFSSTLPMNVYFVLTEEDYNKFMQDEQYNVYPNCFFERQIFKTINCKVSSGGIIIHNPNNQSITYTIN